MKVWSEVHATSGDFRFEPGQRYAVLASVSRNYSLSEIETKATGKGFSITYAWESGAPGRGLYNIDAWLASLPADTTSNHRWVYAEGNFGGAETWTLGQDPPWPFTVYHVAEVFEAVDAPEQAPAPALPTTVAAAPSGSGVFGAVVTLFAILGAAGLGYWAGSAEILPRLGVRL